MIGAVIRQSTGHRTARRIRHCVILDVPTDSEPLIVADAAINIFPTLEDKVYMVQNAIELAHVPGIENPKVAILSAVEVVNPRLQSTVEATALCRMADRGRITGSILDAPFALGNAINQEAARIKGISGAVAGDADILNCAGPGG